MELTFQDKKIICQDCNISFIWTGGDQRFYASKGLFPPKRCPTCRVIRKATIALEDGHR